MAIELARLRRRGRTAAVSVRFEAEFSFGHSLGIVSRELALSLLGRSDLLLRLLDCGPADGSTAEDGKAQMLKGVVDLDPEEEVDVHIRHHWPPNFEPPRSGRWVVCQPWEYGSLPVSWVEAFRDHVDDVWCNSRFVRDAYLRAGFDPERLAMIPLGVDPEVFRPDARPMGLDCGARFKFLYVGGTVHRKGADLLLDAYLRTFSRNDDVAFVVKDMGTRTFYQNQTMGERFLAAAADPTRPEVVYVDAHLPESDLAGLYTACDALVAPYRGEGFLLPALEAMACGRHVIVTAGGATDDYVDGSCGTRIPSRRVETGDTMSDGSKCVAPMFLLEADIHELGRAMRWAYENPEKGRQLGAAAAQRARIDWTWERAADRVVARLRELAHRPIRRFSGGHAVRKETAKPDATAAEDPQPEDPGRLRALELALIRGDLGFSREYLEDLASRESVQPGARAVLLLAEKALASEKGFALKGVPEDRRQPLLERVRGALGRVAGAGALDGSVGRPKVSLTMIVRDEEKNIADCIECVRDLVDEMVVVDTGSRDRTKTIASGLGAKVFDFPWVDSFARARNEALWRASGDWVFWLDADDRVDANNRSRLKEVLGSLPRGRIIGYSMKVECVAQRGASPTVVDHVRVFPRHSALRWEYRVHENILPAINRLGGEVRWTDVTIHHLGYLDEGIRERKRLRDQMLLAKNLEECPEDPFLHFNLGHSLIDGGDLDRAAEHLRESIARSEPHYSQVKKAYALLAQVERNRGRLDAALEVLAEGRTHYPANAELLFFSGVYLHEKGRHKDAADCFEGILKTKAWPQEFGSFDVGILSHKSSHRLAMVYCDLGRRAEAEAMLTELRRTNPDYLPAVLDLARLRVAVGKGQEARALLADLRGCGLYVEALALEGRVLLGEGQFEEALAAFEKTLELEPRHEEAYSGLVEASSKLGRKEKVEEVLRKRVLANPRSAAAEYDLARFLLHSARQGEALAELERALALAPRHGPSAELKARILREDRAGDQSE
jgi:glycosyltransferase involved in cell wall biosynthesis/tetratricopeptide (TPR) repeat protein